MCYAHISLAVREAHHYSQCLCWQADFHSHHSPQNHSGGKVLPAGLLQTAQPASAPARRWSAYPDACAHCGWCPVIGWQGAAVAPRMCHRSRRAAACNDKQKKSRCERSAARCCVFCSCSCRYSGRKGYVDKKICAVAAIVKGSFLLSHMRFQFDSFRKFFPMFRALDP